MADWENIEESETAINCSFEFCMLRPVHPFKNWKYENGNGQTHDDNFIYYGHLQIAVHTVVEWGECTSSDQNTDSCVVKSAEYFVGFYLINKKNTAAHWVEKMKQGTAQ